MFAQHWAIVRKVLSKVLNTLRKQTFTHPWVIVRQKPLQSAKHIEEANVRPSLGDHSQKCSQ
jgi:hypothetical protein